MHRFLYVQACLFPHNLQKNKILHHIASKEPQCNTMKSEMGHALKLYQVRDFRVVDIHSNMEFECVQHNFLLTILNLTPCNAHIGEAECSIWTIKEQV